MLRFRKWIDVMTVGVNNSMRVTVSLLRNCFKLQYGIATKLRGKTGN